MFGSFSRRIGGAALAGVVLILGVSRAQVGWQRLDAGPTFGSASAAVPTVEQELADLRTERQMIARAQVAAQGAQALDPGATFTEAASAAAPTIEEEMAYFRAEIRQLARERSAAIVRELETSVSATTAQFFAHEWSPPYAQELVGLRFESNCVTHFVPGTNWASGSAYAATEVVCLQVLA